MVEVRTGRTPQTPDVFFYRGTKVGPTRPSRYPSPQPHLRTLSRPGPGISLVLYPHSPNKEPSEFQVRGQDLNRT